MHHYTPCLKYWWQMKQRTKDRSGLADDMQKPQTQQQVRVAFRLTPGVLKGTGRGQWESSGQHCRLEPTTSPPQLSGPTENMLDRSSASTAVQLKRESSTYCGAPVHTLLIFVYTQAHSYTHTHTNKQTNKYTHKMTVVDCAGMKTISFDHMMFLLRGRWCVDSV